MLKNLKMVEAIVERAVENTLIIKGRGILDANKEYHIVWCKVHSENQIEVKSKCGGYNTVFISFKGLLFDPGFMCAVYPQTYCTNHSQLTKSINDIASNKSCGMFNNCSECEDEIPCGTFYGQQALALSHQGKPYIQYLYDKMEVTNGNKS